MRETSEAPGNRVTRAIVVGAIAVAALDILDAFVFFGMRGVEPVRILQSIASGVLGRDAFSGGVATATLGGLLHLLIAVVVVSTYVLASRRQPALARRPLLFGPLYGLLVYGVMYGIVLPWSAAAAGPRPAAVVANGILIHVLGVGVPAALAARAALGAERRRP
jgi:hypothetical protein